MRAAATATMANHVHPSSAKIAYKRLMRNRSLGRDLIERHVFDRARVGEPGGEFLAAAAAVARARWIFGAAEGARTTIRGEGWAALDAEDRHRAADDGAD